MTLECWGECALIFGYLSGFSELSQSADVTIYVHQDLVCALEIELSGQSGCLACTRLWVQSLAPHKTTHTPIIQAPWDIEVEASVVQAHLYPLSTFEPSLNI